MGWHRQRVMRTPLEVIMDVEAELALHGYPDPPASLFRGCHICLLPPSALQASPSERGNSTQAAAYSIPEARLFQSTRELAKSAADTELALVECQAKRVSLQVLACLLMALVYCTCHADWQAD